VEIGKRAIANCCRAGGAGLLTLPSNGAAVVLVISPSSSRAIVLGWE